MIRNIQSSDYKKIISVVDMWWGGRRMSDMLPKLFFVHFQQTSFVVVEDGDIVGFLVGFQSQTYSKEAYIHFVGVHPEYRKAGVARELYERFFEIGKQLGCDTVRCVTSPVNKTSIAYHTRMGFVMEEGDALQDGVPVHTDYDGRGGSRVLFVKKLES
nr:GNAT family N-acetyltransferase [Bacillus sp. FJAT-49736]